MSGNVIGSSVEDGTTLLQGIGFNDSTLFDDDDDNNYTGNGARAQQYKTGAAVGGGLSGGIIGTAASKREWEELQWGDVAGEIDFGKQARVSGFDDDFYDEADARLAKSNYNYMAKSFI